MSGVEVALPGPVAVILDARAITDLAACTRRGEDAISAGVLVQTLGRLAAAGELGGRVEADRRGGPRLYVCTDRHFAALEPSARGHAYVMTSVESRNLDHDRRMASGSLRLRCTGGWRGCVSLDDVPPGWSAHWELIQAAWARLEGKGSNAAPQQRRAAYLDLLRRVVQASFEIRPDRGTYAAQRDAIDRFETARAAAPHLLDVLVEHRPQPAELVVRALPGTDRTRTIAEIVRAHAGRGTLLLTAQTDRAIGDVLAELPDDVLSVQVGGEDGVAPQARALMAEIRQATEQSARQLAVLLQHDEVIEGHAATLADRLAAARQADAEVTARSEQLAAAMRRVTAATEPGVRAAASALADRRADVERLERGLEMWRGRRDGAALRADSFPLYLVMTPVVGSLRRRADSVERALEIARYRVTEAERTCTAEQARGAEQIANDPDVRALGVGRRAASAAREEALEQAGRAAEVVRAALAPAGLTGPERPTDLESWNRFEEWVRLALPLARARAALLRDFRDLLDERSPRLQRDLVRCADVVGATIPVVGTSPLLTDAEFALTIADEAGGVSLPALLVPLARARRAVVAGDPEQRPPCDDDRVRHLPAEIRDVLCVSAFERLHDAVDDHRDARSEPPGPE